MRSGFWSRTSIIPQVIVAICFEFAGAAAFVYYLLEKEFLKSIWGFLTAFFAIALIHLHILFLKNDLDDWYEPSAFDPIRVLSLLVMILSLINGSYSLYVAYYANEIFDLESNYVNSILAFMCTLLTFVIILCTRKYKRYVQMCQPILPHRY